MSGLPHFDKTQKKFTSILSAHKLSQMIRVNQAGEFGATRIYKGQRAILKKHPKGQMIEHMLEQEQEHLKRFNQMMVERKVRPTALAPLWHVAGFALGAGTALMGWKSAMACTEAVEEVIDEHYASQEQKLGDTHPELKRLISQCRAEENEHKQLSLDEGAAQAPGYPVLSKTIKAATRLAIWLSTRI